MAKPINIRVAHNSVKSTVKETDKAVLKFAKFIRKNDMKLRNFKFPSRNRMKYLKTIDLSVIGKNEKGGFSLSLPSPFGVATNNLLSRVIDGAAMVTILGTAGAWLPALVPELVNSQERETAKAPGTREEKLRALYEQRKNLKWWDWVTGVAQEVDEQIYFLETGQTKSYGKNLTPRTPSDFGPGEWTEGGTKKSLDIGKFASTISLFGALASQGAFAGGTPVAYKKEPSTPSTPSNAIPVSRTMGGQINTANLGAGGLHPFPGGNRVSSEVGMRNGRYHWGTDIAETGPFRAEARTPILAMDDGVVIEDKYNDGKDAYLAGLMIKHQGLNVDARYLHMNPYFKPGDTVKRGQIIGSLVPIALGNDPNGNNHLHLELYEPGTSKNYDAARSEKFLSGLTPVPFASVNEAQKIQPNIPATPAGEPQSTSVPTQPPVPTTSNQPTPQEQAVESKKKLEELTTQIQELKDSKDINRVDEKVRIPEVGTYVFGRSWWGGQEDKYFTPNGEPISKEEFEERLLKYEEKLAEQSKAEPATSQTTTVPAPSSSSDPSQDPIVTNPTTADPVRREAPPVATYPSYNKPGRVNNTIITTNQMPQGHKSPNVMANGGPGGMTVIPLPADTAAVASSILLTQLSGS